MIFICYECDPIPCVFGCVRIICKLWCFYVLSIGYLQWHGFTWHNGDH
jgi:hypothetical protein